MLPAIDPPNRNQNPSRHLRRIHQAPGVISFVALLSVLAHHPYAFVSSLRKLFAHLMLFSRSSFALWQLSVFVLRF
jgi:hypothetical protein